MITLEQATLLARHAHAGQLDKAGRPYIDHVIAVSALLEPHGQTTQIVGVLHDILEDTPATREELADHGCTEQILHALDALTRRPNETYDDAVHRAAQNPLARLVKLADNLHNSAPHRLAQLDEATAERLKAKYAAARNTLLAAGRDYHHATPIPRTITAVHWDSTNAAQATALLGMDRFTYLAPDDRGEDPDATAAYRDRHNTWVPIAPGIWLVPTADGEHFTHLSDEEFHLTYRQANTPITYEEYLRAHNGAGTQ